MKNFLAIDTSSKYLSVICGKDSPCFVYTQDCAMQHSVKLMDAIEEALEKASMTVKDIDFFGVCVGPGSFTGIRIGIATIKGFVSATGKPCIPVTAFDCIAYTVKEENILAVIDAGHEFYYVCGYDKQKNITLPPAYVDEETVKKLSEKYVLASFQALPFSTIKADMQQGFFKAIEKLQAMGKYNQPSALYVQKCQAERERK